MSSTACSGCSTPERPGVICPNATATEKPSTADIAAGYAKACSTVFLSAFNFNSTTKSAPTGRSLISMAATFVPTTLRRVLEKKRPVGEPKDHARGRSRGDSSTKLHVVTDGQGLPLAVTLTAGQCHESTVFELLMNMVKVGSRRRPIAVAGDRAYDVGRIRQWCRRRGIKR